MRRLLLLVAIGSVACAFEPPSARIPDASIAGEDATLPDADPIDAESNDIEPIDAGTIDGDAIDAEPTDGEPVDAEPIDAEPIDAEPMDAEVTDAGPSCGNGVVEDDEICDDGDLLPGDGCNAACDVESGFTCDRAQPTVCSPTCGDGFIRGNEQCDDGGAIAGDGCARNCRREQGYQCSGEPSECTLWWDSTNLRRRWIGVDRSGVDEELTDFPILVVLTPARIDYAASAPDGTDLRFIADDQLTVLPHEIESWNPGGTSHVWVRMPSIRADGTTTELDRIWMYYDGPGTVPAPAPTQVWSDGFQTVWHLREQPSGAAGEIDDSTANDHRGQTFGAMSAAASVPAQVGRGLQFDGVNDLIDFGAIDTDAFEALTLEAWVRWSNGSDHAISKAFGTQVGEHIFSLEVPNGSSARARITTNGGNGGSSQASSMTGSVSSGRWHYLVGTWSAADPRVRIYIDGVEAASIARTGNTVQSSTERVVVGNINLTQARYFGGVIDEARVSNAVRSPEWIEAQHRSMTDSLVVFSAEQTAP